MATTYIIDRNLTIDSTGKITQYNLNSIEAVKNLVDLYLQFALKEVPYSEFGNNLLESVFRVLNDELANDMVKKLITDLASLYNIIIKKYDYTVNRSLRKLSIRITFADNTTNEFIYSTISNPSKNGVVIDRSINNIPTCSNTYITMSESGSSVSLFWNEANIDNYEYNKTLQYKIYSSTSANINDLATIEANGTVVLNYMNDISTYTINTLASGTYYFNIVVRDANNIKLLYTMKEFIKS